MNIPSRSLRFIVPLLCALALLMLTAPARAQINLLDGPSPIEYSGTAATLNPATFTVSPGASVLVVCYGSRTQGDSPGSDPGVPPNMAWNGHPLTKVVSQSDTAATWDDNTIYYMTNPPAGTGSMTGTVPASVNQIFWMAYTLTGVNVSVAPLTGTAFTTSGTTISDTVAKVPAGGWAAISTSGGAVNSTITETVTPAGGTLVPIVLNSDGNASQNMGYVSNCPASNLIFTTTDSASGSKMVLVDAVFTAAPFTTPAFVVTQPEPSIVYANVTATFTVVGGGSPLPSYYWQKDGVNLANGGNISGATNATLTVSGVSSGDVASYTVVVSNTAGAVTSSVATLTIVSPVEPYEQAVASLNPIAFYEFNDTNNPATSNAEAFDYAGGFNGVYGPSVQNGNPNYGIQGPTSSTGFPGFNSTNLAAQFTPTAGNNVDLPPWNNSGNAMTFTAWINPGGIQNPAAAIVICRGNTTVAGLAYLGAVTNGNVPLGYVWNNDPATYNWNSGLVPPSGQWSFVALVITPADATIYMMNANGLASSSQAYPNPVQSFNTNEYIGEDAAEEGGNGTRSFLGTIDDVAVFNTALSMDQVAGLFYSATGVTNYAPVIGVQPLSQTVYVGQTVQLYAGADGSEPLTYQWAAGSIGSGGPYTPLTDGVNGVSGSKTPTLTIQNISLNQSLDYVVTVANKALGSPAVSAPATLSVQPTSAPIFNITMAVQETAGDDWNVFSAAAADQWSIGQVPASVSAVEYPGSTYEILPGARLRTPAATTTAVFPGDVLLLDGAGFINNPGAGSTQGEIRFKQPQLIDGAYGTVTFPLLVFNGGQLDIGNDGIIAIYGGINVLSNGIFYSDSTDDRGYVINAQLTGSNSIQYFGDSVTYPEFYTNVVNGGVTNILNIGTTTNANYTNNLDIAGTSNTFSGPWFVEAGMLLGSVSNCLGTNNITVLSNGVFQTLYDINNTNADLVVQGKMFLTQDDTFASVIVGSFSLPTGTYTAAQLCAEYPTYFPASWVPHYGAATQTNATGSITVLVNSGATIVQNPLPAAVSLYPSQSTQFTAIGGGASPLTYQWRYNGVKLTDGTNLIGGLSFMINGSQTSTLSLSNIPASYGGSYTIIVSNALSSVTSAPAILTMLPTLPPENIQLNLLEPAGDDWNTPGVWNDGAGGLPASTSALEYYGSTYEVPAGMLLRTPTAAIPYTNFPGMQLTVDGSGVFFNNGANVTGTAQGEIRFKEGTSGETNYFPLLIMAGGQLDTGVTAVTEIAGTMDVISNTPIYVDSAAGAGNPRPYQIDAYLEGNGSIQYIDFDATLSGCLDITGNTNSYTGTWNVVQGPLLGSGLNSLGTNNITVGASGVLETLYNINSPHALLTLNGRMFLHQNDTFGQVQIGNVGLVAGTYSYAALAAAFPATFPATWTSIYGSSVSNASGSITALSTLVLPPFIASQPPANAVEFIGAKVTYSVTVGGSAGTYQWYVNGSLVNGATGSAYTFTSTAGPNTYYCVVSNSAGVVTNMVATNSATTAPVAVTFDDTQNWSLQGTNIIPSFSGGVPEALTLTDNNLNEAGSAFYETAQYIESFDASFTYTPSGNLAADGITFCVQNAAAGSSALGATGGDLGYLGITNSAAFELNIYALATGGVGIGFGTNGQIALPYGAVTNVNPADAIDLASGDPINVNLYYSGGVMQAILMDTVTSATFVTNVTMGDFGALAGDSVGYIGFTGGDGGSASSQAISNFSFLSAAPPALTISNSGGGSFTISWSDAVLPAFVLQQAPSPVGPWSNVSATPTLVGSQYQVVLTPGAGPQYYRFGLK